MFELVRQPLVAILLAPFIGSFLGVVILRLPTGARIVWSRSLCPNCQRRLVAYDLVPLVSWIVTKGHCRYCEAKLSIFYPAIELAAAGVAIWATTIVSGWLLWVSCALGWALLVLAIIDARELILCDEVTLPLVPAGLLVGYFIEPSGVLDHVLGAAGGYLAILLLAVTYRRVRGRDGIGMGDAKFMAAAGAWVTWAGLASVILIAALTAFSWLFIRSLSGMPLARDQRIPFGTFLALGLWLVWLYGPLVIT